MPQSHSKIESLDGLLARIPAQRESGKRVALCGGEFNILHPGHTHHLKRLAEAADILIVVIASTNGSSGNEGLPGFPEDQRAESVAALGCVDYVMVHDENDMCPVIERLKPDLFAVAWEADGLDEKNGYDASREIQLLESYGGEFLPTEPIQYLSPNTLNRYFGVLPQETKEYLSQLRKGYSHLDIMGLLGPLKDLEVMVIGDAIIDEYHYTTPLGQSGKGFHMAVKYDSVEKFAGGAMAVANHLAGFVRKVTLVTGLGAKDNQEEFVRSQLKSNVEPLFFYFEDAPTVVKLRFVDNDLLKLFEVYYYNEEPEVENLNKEVCPWLQKNGPSYDMVFASDFGNGFISPEMIEALVEGARYLSVNTQINSGNRGYHVVNRYPRADFISLNEPELRLATHNRHDPLEELMVRLVEQAQAKTIAVTRGTRGAVVYDKKSEAFLHLPVLSTKVLDRIGAGDAFLALTGLCLGKGLPVEVASFVGSAAAALNVQTVCNKESITRSNLFKYMTTLLQ